MAQLLIPGADGSTVRVLLDDEDLDRVTAGGKWHAYKKPEDGTAYVFTNKIEGIRKKVRLHRWLLDAPADKLVDHVNGDGLDNRRANLRICSRSQNGMNRGATRVNACGLKGVYFDPKTGLYRARITALGVRRSLGHFASAEEAHAAYSEAAVNLHLEFARTK